MHGQYTVPNEGHCVHSCLNTGPAAHIQFWWEKFKSKGHIFERPDITGQHFTIRQKLLPLLVLAKVACSKKPPRLWSTNQVSFTVLCKAWGSFLKCLQNVTWRYMTVHSCCGCACGHWTDSAIWSAICFFIFSYLFFAAVSRCFTCLVSAIMHCHSAASVAWNPEFWWKWLIIKKWQ